MTVVVQYFCHSIIYPARSLLRRRYSCCPASDFHKRHYRYMERCYQHRCPGFYYLYLHSGCRSVRYYSHYDRRGQRSCHSIIYPARSLLRRRYSCCPASDFNKLNNRYMERCYQHRCPGFYHLYLHPRRRSVRYYCHYDRRGQCSCHSIIYPARSLLRRRYSCCPASVFHKLDNRYMERCYQHRCPGFNHLYLHPCCRPVRRYGPDDCRGQCFCHSIIYPARSLLRRRYSCCPASDFYKLNNRYMERCYQHRCPGSTTYTFTPAAGQCATTATMTVVVNTPVTPYLPS